jgi:hypothetical protein
MIKNSNNTDTISVISDMLQFLVLEVRKEKGIDISSYFDGALDGSPFEIDVVDPDKEYRGYVRYRDRLYPVYRCEFVYKNNFTNWATREKHSIGEQCTKDALFDYNYCSSHKNSAHAKAMKKAEYLNTIAFTEYYPRPEELTHLYDNVYADQNNIIAMRNSDPDTKYNWKLICRSKVHPSGKRILCSFRQNYINELNRKQKENDYNYIVDPSLFKKARLDYSDYQMSSDDEDSLDYML